jgi:hypothetical protein
VPPPGPVFAPGHGRSAAVRFRGTRAYRGDRSPRRPPRRAVGWRKTRTVGRGRGAGGDGVTPRRGRTAATDRDGATGGGRRRHPAFPPRRRAATRSIAARSVAGRRRRRARRAGAPAGGAAPAAATGGIILGPPLCGAGSRRAWLATGGRFRTILPVSLALLSLATAHRTCSDRAPRAVAPALAATSPGSSTANTRTEKATACCQARRGWLVLAQIRATLLWGRHAMP